MMHSRNPSPYPEDFTLLLRAATVPNLLPWYDRSFLSQSGYSTLEGYVAIGSGGSLIVSRVIVK